MTNHTNSTIPQNKMHRVLTAPEQSLNHKYRDQLRSAGLGSIDMLRGETFHLANTLMPTENILAAIFGRIQDGTPTLYLITDHRIVYINETLLIMDVDSLSYDDVQDVNIDADRFSSIIEMYTTKGNYFIQTRNREAATRFVDSLGKIRG